MVLAAAVTGPFTYRRSRVKYSDHGDKNVTE